MTGRAPGTTQRVESDRSGDLHSDLQNLTPDASLLNAAHHTPYQEPALLFVTTELTLWNAGPLALSLPLEALLPTWLAIVFFPGPEDELTSCLILAISVVVVVGTIRFARFVRNCCYTRRRARSRWHDLVVHNSDLELQRCHDWVVWYRWRE